MSGMNERRAHQLDHTTGILEAKVTALILLVAVQNCTVAVMTGQWRVECKKVLEEDQGKNLILVAYVHTKTSDLP